MENTLQEKKPVSATAKDCQYLYWNNVLAHMLLCGLFYFVQINFLMAYHAIAMVMYLVGAFCVVRTKKISFWILLVAGEIVLHAFLSNFVLGWGYGFSLVGLTLVPIIFYFVYKEEERNRMDAWAIGLSIFDVSMMVLSCVLNRDFNSQTQISEHMVSVIFLVNVLVCSYTLIFYSHGFISEMNAKTASLRYKNEEFDYTCHYDVLTNIYSRDYFYEKAQELILKNPEHSFYMVCTDIKDFKLINDLYGKEIADNLLIKEADLLKKYFQNETAVYGRLSGDKFALCISADTIWEPNFLRMVDNLKGMFRKSSYQLLVYAGVYKLSDIQERMSVACDKASLAIETIKGDYQKQVAYYTKDFLEKEIERKQVLGEFDVALKRNQFCIYLQPQTASDGSALGAEALVRWYHPTKGLVMPGGFIEHLEQAGLIHKLDAYVWEQAASRLAKWKKQGREDLHISVNISTMDFFYMDIYATITGLVEKYDISPKNLRLEITETALAKNFADILEIANKLQMEGYIIEIDDFGSGYSSFNMLKDLNADVLKIDREFLKETANQKRSKAILEGIFALSSKMKMDVITEGVETKEQVEMLTDMGCGMFQGYYFSKPISIEEFEERYVS